MSVRDQLIAAAREVRERAYAPYSGYRVGAALSAGGRVFTGANVENASYGLCICAERVACCNAAIAGVRDIEMIAVVTSSSPPAGPCGMCLQTLREFSEHPGKLVIVMVNTDGEQSEATLAQLSPMAFHNSQLTP
jgi:cytidine deaminase